MRLIGLCLLTLTTCFAQSGANSPELLINAGHWKRARAIIDARLRTNPRDAQALYFASKIQASFGALDRALQSAEQAAEIGPNNPDFLAQIAEMHARMADHVGVIKQVSYVRQLKHEIESALAVNPRHVDTLLVDISFLSRAPVVAGGDRKKARTLAQQMAQFSPGWGNLIQARLVEAEHDDSMIEQALVRAVRGEPSFYLAHFYLGKFYCCAGASKRYAAAEKEAREMIRLDAGQAGGYDILARVLAAQGRWSELDSLLVEAERKVPDDLSPYYQAAQILFEQGKDFDRAEKFVRKYLTQEPEGRQPTVSQGRVLLASINGKGSKRLAD